MTSLSDVPFVARTELVFEPLGTDDHGRTSAWIVFDPVSRRSFRVGWLEHWLLQHFERGKLSRQASSHRTQTGTWLQHIQRQLQGDHGHTASIAHLAEKINELCQSQLLKRIDADASPGPHKSRVRNWLSLSNLWTWRLRGPNPDKWLGSIAPKCDFLLSQVAVRCWIAFAILTAFSVLLDFPRFLRHLAWIDMGNLTHSGRLADLAQQFLQPGTGGIFALIFLVTRFVHELGHALACKRFGIRCPDIGFLLVLGAPCVYCDVTESWRLPRARDRAAIASAGVYFELILAACAAWVWLLTVDGMVNSLALQTCLCCSVLTLLINANPLLRFDGYHVLADWLGEANLRSRADKTALTWLSQMVIGQAVSTDDDSDESRVSDGMSSRRKFGLILFAGLGFVYRFALSLGLTSLLMWTCAGWQLPWLGRGMAVLLLVSWWGLPMTRWLRSLVGQARTTPSRLRLSFVALCSCALFLWLPIPQRYTAQGWVQPKHSQGVYTNSAGRLADIQVEDGSLVRVNQPLFEIANPQLQIEQLRHASKVADAKIRLASFQRQRDMYGAPVDLRPLASALQTANIRSESAHQRCDELQLRAPCNGLFCANAVDPALSDQQKWTNQQLVGKSIAHGTMLGFVCSRESVAVIPLSASQLESVALGTEARIRVWNGASPAVIAGRVTSVVRLEKLRAPMVMPSVATSSSPNENTSDRSSAFAAVIELPSQEEFIRPGHEVSAVFVGQAKSIFECGLDWLSLNIRLLAD